jgi:hypothetical protein
MNGMLYASQLGDYIRSERDRLQPLGRSLDESDRFALREHFKADLLADVTAGDRGTNQRAGPRGTNSCGGDGSPDPADRRRGHVGSSDRG